MSTLQPAQCSISAIGKVLVPLPDTHTHTHPPTPPHPHIPACNRPRRRTKSVKLPRTHWFDSEAVSRHTMDVSVTWCYPIEDLQCTSNGVQALNCILHHFQQPTPIKAKRGASAFWCVSTVGCVFSTNCPRLSAFTYPHTPIPHHTHTPTHTPHTPPPPQKPNSSSKISNYQSTFEYFTFFRSENFSVVSCNQFTSD